MQNKKLSIRKIVNYLNDEQAEGGGFWLPNIQRPFVWSEEQIAKLFDSIMREYPISTLLVWKTKEPVKHRKFIDLYKHDIKLSSYFVPDHSRAKMMVLDGQQRLQSLFIGLKGSYEGKELYFDVMSGSVAAPDEIRYRFAFKATAQAAWPWVRFKDIVFPTNKLDLQIAQALAGLSPTALGDTDLMTLQLNVARARQEFVNDDKHQRHHRQLGVHPAIARSPADAITHPEPDPECQRRHRQQRGEAHQLARHQHQPLVFGLRVGRHHGQIHKNPGQVEQAGKPAGDKDDVKGFDPEHGREFRPSRPARAGQKKTQHKGWGDKPFCCHTSRPRSGRKSGRRRTAQP